MKREATFLLQILAALLVYSSLAWSQEFDTNVVGSATACGVTNKYSQSGPLRSFGAAGSTCPLPPDGAAFATSQADLNLGSNGNVVTQGNGSGKAAALTSDTVTLIPPPSFHGTSVKFTVVDAYAMSIKSLGGTGSSKMCWTLSGLFNHCLASSGTVKGTFKSQVTLNKSQTGFQFKVTKTMNATGTGNVNAGFATTGDPNFILPQGWTCTFASGVGCR